MDQKIKFIRLNRFLTIILIVAGLTFFLYSCAVPYKYPSYPGHKTFIETNISQLRIGMTTDQCLAIFGRPDKTYDATFGENVGEAWTGHVWLYFTERDPTFEHVKRYKKNTFVFYTSGGQKLLNHWNIEK